MKKLTSILTGVALSSLLSMPIGAIAAGGVPFGQGQGQGQAAPPETPANTKEFKHQSSRTLERSFTAPGGGSMDSTKRRAGSTSQHFIPAKPPEPR